MMTAAFMRRSESVFDLFPVAKALVAGISADYTGTPPRRFPGGSIAGWLRRLTDRQCACRRNAERAASQSSNGVPGKNRQCCTSASKSHVRGVDGDLPGSIHFTRIVYLSFTFGKRDGPSAWSLVDLDGHGISVKRPSTSSTMPTKPAPARFSWDCNIHLIETGISALCPGIEHGGVLAATGCGHTR